MFEKILIANRGEIACRIARTARRLGIKTVAVYSDADRDALHVKQCDESFYIGESSAELSYLCAQKIINAAQQTGCEAIHPGYGFLSENHEFAISCAQGDIVFIGPPAEAIRIMGGKDAAKQAMRDAGIAVVAGYDGAAQSLSALQVAADEIGYPLLIKAVCGGGGKGMRQVARDEEFADALAAVQREATAAFGDDRVLLEKFLPRARHVEVQVFADQHGAAIHLYERDCSIQRRHQKVIEEAPAPGLDETLRQAIGAAAVNAAQAIGYVGAGTVEFLLDEAMQFYFMEMNTRLQVEHPVTEMITGYDLVEWQFRVAAGAPLPCRQQEVRINGHAMEARVYAENPDNDFLPAVGVLDVYRPPREGDEVRIDSGVTQGDEILPYYDPMIAKLIVHGADRESARRQLRDALAEFDIAGVATNLDFLYALTNAEDFVNANLDTDLIARNYESLFAGREKIPQECLAVAALFELQFCSVVNANSDDIFSPWVSSSWWLNLPVDLSYKFSVGANELECKVKIKNEQPYALINNEWLPIRLTKLKDARFQFQCGEKLRTVTVDKLNNVTHIKIAGRRIALSLINETNDITTTHDAGGLTAPMSGTIIAVTVREKQQVKRGDSLLTLEAMKMEHTIRAPHDGLVTKLFFRRGDQVRDGDELLALETTK